ncbi:DEAD/DEAH box helicase [Flavobacterium rhizosphaerae]|uniref:DEAD/DEAH box helicase n=1 Tax=Flavobacterium rhizosphaerae TaxID=3163298 RepID=A0ABW8YTR8_9FLAO
MKLKKINTNLQKALQEAGLTEPTTLQNDSFGTIKSGADCVIAGPSSEGKTTAIVIHVIQRLEKAFMQSPRALVIVQDKEKVLEMLEMFSKYAKYTDLRAYGVYEKTDMDEDKNQISDGIDVLIGTPQKLNDMFSTAGYDVNQLKMFIVDDTELLLKNRLESKISRVSNSIQKTQRIFFTDIITDRVEFLADRIMVEPIFLEMDEDDEES